MMKKFCNKCGEEKELTIEFWHKDKTHKDGFRSQCKICISIYQIENKENISKVFKKYRQKNKEKYIQYMNEYNKQYYQENKKEILEQSKEYRHENIDEIKNRNKIYYEKNKENLLKKAKKYREKNKEKRIEYDKRYYEENREKILEQNKEYIYKKRNTNVSFKLRQNVSHRISQDLISQKTSKGKKSCWGYLPYTSQQLKEHLEKQFEPWMNWKNYGPAKNDGIKRWNIDHIIPQSKLSYDSMEHINFQKCWALENLRPLEAIENIRKGNN